MEFAFFSWKPTFHFFFCSFFRFFMVPWKADVHFEGQLQSVPFLVTYTKTTSHSYIAKIDIRIIFRFVRNRTWCIIYRRILNFLSSEKRAFFLYSFRSATSESVEGMRESLYEIEYHFPCFNSRHACMREILNCAFFLPPALLSISLHFSSLFFSNSLYQARALECARFFVHFFSRFVIWSIQLRRLSKTIFCLSFRFPGGTELRAFAYRPEAHESFTLHTPKPQETYRKQPRECEREREWKRERLLLLKMRERWRGRKMELKKKDLKPEVREFIGRVNGC